MRRTALVALATATLCAAAPQTAEACGGTFCDGGPQSMPVDQSGENILFVIDEAEGSVEVHIQIQYEGEAAKFAWVVPLMGLPDFSVGSEQLFANLLAGSVPNYGFSTTRDDCSDPDPAPDNGDGWSTGAGDSSAGGTDGATGGETGGGGGPDVVYQDTVGAYDIVVLEGGTAAEVSQWLNDNGYQWDPEAEPILEEYLEEGALFAAFKLTGGADVDEIHPVALKYQGVEPCVPIRLTRIAAVDDMEIRTFFLGEHRAAPTNYKHVLVNPLKLDWLMLAANYKEIITLAVDTAVADGKAFVTEYAGGSEVVMQDGLRGPGWDSSTFVSAAAIDVVDRLEDQGLAYCYESGCDFQHTLVLPLLHEFLPVPDGVEEVSFYSCLSCFEDLIDPAVWDGPAFAAALEERIISPGEHAVELLQTWPYLTRMYTTISPTEMTLDPIFHENPDLDDVDLTNQIGQNRILCNNDSVFTLPDGREIYIPASAGQTWPSFPDEMPFVEEIAEVPFAGAPMVLVANTDRIDALLADHNAQYAWPPEGGTGGGGDGAGGCACTVAEPRTGALFGFGLTLGLGLFGGRVMRRRKR